MSVRKAGSAESANRAASPMHATTTPAALNTSTTTSAHHQQQAQQQQQFTPRPPPKKDASGVLVGNTSPPSASTNLPVLAATGGGAHAGGGASSSAAPTTTTPNKVSLATIARLPPSQRKQHFAAATVTSTTQQQRAEDGAMPGGTAPAVPISPSASARERVLFPSPNTPNGSSNHHFLFSSPAAPHTPTGAGTIGGGSSSVEFPTVVHPSVIGSYPMHSPSPLGAAYDEVRIPTELPFFVASPSSATHGGLVHPQATNPTEAAAPQPGAFIAPSLPSAHAVVPLPLSFHYSSSSAAAATQQGSAAANAVVNLPNILIPPTPSMPSPVMWMTPESTQVPGAAHAVVSIPGHQQTEWATPSPVLAPSQSNSPFVTAAVPPSASSPSPSPVPLSSTSSMDSRQWASLLLKYRAGESTTAATPSSRANPAANVHAHQSTSIQQGVSPAAGSPGSILSPVYSPNALGGARPSSRARSRQGGPKPATPAALTAAVATTPTLVAMGEEDPEKTAMQNELHRLRAVIAMQTHAATSPALHPTAISLAHANPIPVAAPMMQHQSYQPQQSTPVSGGAGLSWNTAFNALSSNSNFWQSQASPSPGPVVAPSPAMSSAYASSSGVVGVGDGPLFSSLPPAVDAAPQVDYRSTFRNMSMLIRSGTASHAQPTHHTATTTTTAALPSSLTNSPHLHPPPSGLLTRSRSAEEPNHAAHYALSSRGISHAATATASAAHAQPTHTHHEIDEDLTSSPVLTGAAHGRSVFAVQRAFVEQQHQQAAGSSDHANGISDGEIEEESHLRATEPPMPAAAEAGASATTCPHEPEAPAESSTEEPPPRIGTTGRTAAGSTSSSALVSTPLFLPPSHYTAASRSGLKTPRSGHPGGSAAASSLVCSEAPCQQRAQSDRADLQRLTDELASVKAKSAAELKSAHARYKRELGQKEARVHQLEKLQTKLLQPHSKLVAQVEELTAVVQKLRDQLVGLGVSPIAGTAALNVAREAEQKQAHVLTPPQSHHHVQLNQQREREETSPTRMLLPPGATHAAADAASGPDGEDATSPTTSSSSTTADPAALSHRSHAEPFFNTSAPRTVTSKSRRRSQSFNSGVAPSKLLSRHARERFEKEYTSSSSSVHIGVDGVSFGHSTGTHSPRSSPLTIAMPSRPTNASTGGLSRPRKNSLKTAANTAQAKEHGATEGATHAAVIASAIPVASRPPRQQSRGRVVPPPPPPPSPPEIPPPN